MLRLASVFALACVCLPVTDASAGSQASCLQRSLHELQQRAPDGYAIYTAIPDKKFFSQWITCDNIQIELSTAVHESVHYITENRDAYPLIDGSAVKRPHEVSKFVAPAIIAKKFESRALFRSMFVSTYLQRGNASFLVDALK